MTLAKMSVYFFIVGTGSGGPFVFASLGLGGQLVQNTDFLPLSTGREVFICLVNIKWSSQLRTRAVAPSPKFTSRVPTALKELIQT